VTSQVNELLKVLVTGAQGQLGGALLDSVPDQVVLRGVTRAELDIADATAVQRLIDEFKPDLIINAAAYTAVDKAESDVAAAEQGNIDGPRNLARAALTLPKTRLLHVSTDFVFDGAGCKPYAPNASPAPLGIYGQTKLVGEQAVQSLLGERALIVRTAWVYDAKGKNFMRTMLRLMNQSGAVRVVADQVGTPTSAQSLAQVLWRFAARAELSGIFHWTDAGVASWYDFAVAISEEALALGLLPTMPKVQPIATHEYPTSARRPAYSVLDKSATYAALEVSPVHWRVRLREAMQQVQL
jgi:dTDP-4-dehydrorhamnose reductase